MLRALETTADIKCWKTLSVYIGVEKTKKYYLQIL